MDGKSMEEIRTALLNRWTRIGKTTETNLDALDNGPQAEIIDIAQAVEQMGRDMSLAEQERRDLIAVERALAKMASGSFGICEECGEEIAARRLMAVPEARFCAHCQTYIERQNQRIRPYGVAAR